jgi:hypothetical protein
MKHFKIRNLLANRGIELTPDEALVITNQLQFVYDNLTQSDIDQILNSQFVEESVKEVFAHIGKLKFE